MGDYANDLVLLERVLLKLGLADSDEQLEAQLNKFLGPVLLKIVSPSEDVRKKVMEILTHINKRLKSRPEVKLDLAPIVKHYQDSSNSFLINFAIIYITLGFPRLTVEKQTDLLPLILHCLEGKPEPHQNKLLMLILPLLSDFKLPENPEERKTLFGLSDQPRTKSHLLSIFLDILLLPYGHIADTEVPPGMSLYSFRRVILENKKAEHLENLKKGIVKFLDCGVFEENEIVPHLIVASADTRFSVATPALNELNKICTTLDWFDAKTTAPLYVLFSGNGSKVPDRKTSSCSPRVKQKILQHLLKCRGPAINVAKGIQVIFEGLFGESSNQKCKVAALQFASNLVSYGQKDLIEKLSKVLQTYITKLIGTESPEPFDVQNAAYNAIAKLIATCPESFNKDVNLIVDYFNYLNGSTPDLHNSIRDVLVALALAFKWDPSKVISKDEQMELDDEGNAEKKKFSEKFVATSSHILILGVLQDQTESKLPVSQNVASLFLTTCFPSYFVPARYLLLVLCGTSAILRETIYSYLYGHARKDHINYSKLMSCDLVDDDADEKELLINQTIILPGFRPMIHHIAQLAEKKLSGASAVSNSNHKLAFQIDVFTELLDYLRICLWYSAGCISEPGSEKDMQKLIDFIRQLDQSGNIEHIEKYVRLIRNVLVSKKGFVELSCLSDLLTAAPSIITKSNLDLRSNLAGSLREVNETTRTIIAKIYGILLAYGADAESFNEEIKNLLSSSQKSLEYQHGSVSALSNAFYYRIISFLEAKDSEALKQLIASREFTDSIAYLIKLLTDQKSLLAMAAIKGLSLIGCCIKLPLEEIQDQEHSQEKMEVDEHVGTKNYVFKTIFQLLKSSQTKQKIREDAAHCLGHLSIGDREFFAKKVMTNFLEFKRATKDAALHIAIAQGFVFAVAGDPNLPKVITLADDDVTLDWLITELVHAVPEVNVCSRQAVALWLLAIVKACSKRQPILQKRRLLQMAFTNLLSEENELVQDVASRGLGVIFSISSESDQTELSNLLLEQLTEGNKGKVRKVTDDTVLFEDILGKTPTGGNLSTYKELCSLASDLNQPEILYQFMQLANNNANWNSRLGAAFGLQSLSGLANVKMQPYLSKIVPRLFRYKYDPTPKIQNSMISIWDSVVKDNKETMEMYYWEILEDVITNLTHPEWRTRIACCLAVKDLIKGPSGLRLRSQEPSKSTEANKMDVDENVPEPEIKQLWMQLFRVMDDIHEGTREAAEGSAKLLAKLCVSSVSCDHGKSGTSVSSSILPFLLESGVTHTVAEIRRLSLRTVSEMIDSSGQLIHPHLSELIPCLLKATGELDSVKYSMFSTMMSAQSGTQEVVDSVRAEAAKSRYTMETLIKCIKYIDFATLEKTTPAVLELIKSSVVLGTKIAAAHFVCLISVHLSKDMMPLAGKYLSACLVALSDRNTVVRKYYASAIGHLIGIAKESTVVSLFKKLNTLYFEDQGGKSRSIVLTLSAINKKHADIIKDYSASIMPLIFFAKHEEITEDNKTAVELWQELWNDVSFGDSMLQLYLNDIITILENSLNSQSWLLKAQSGASITTVAKRLETSLKDEERARLIELVLSNISGRTFSGKERLVEALAALSSKNASKDLNNRLIEAVLRECRKEEEIYKTKVLKSLGMILEKLEEENRFEDVYNIVWVLLDKQSISSKDDEATSSSGSSNFSNEERNKEKATLINLKEVVCETLGKAWPALKANNSLETQKKYQLLLIVKLTECLKVNTRPIQKSLMVALGLFLEKLHLLNGTNANDDSLLKICDLVMVNVGEASVVPHTGLKKEALQDYIVLIKKLKTINKVAELKFIKSKFDSMLISYAKDSSPEIKLRLQDINELSKDI